MGRIEATFERLRAARKKALVAFVCVGDPSVEASIEIAAACVDAGADVLELGVPFSDPIADGPVIARAGARALRAGSSLRRVLDAARSLRARTDVPLVLFTYFNPVFTYGGARLIEDAAGAGVDALLIVDLPPEEGVDLRAAADAHGLAMIALVSPTTTEARATQTLSHATGFVYYVSVTGVTGSSVAPLGDASTAAEGLRAKSKLPVVVGFGIDSPEKARAAAGPRGQGADGVVVGTAIVRAVELAKTTDEARVAVHELLAGIRTALDRALSLLGRPSFERASSRLRASSCRASAASSRGSLGWAFVSSARRAPPAPAPRASRARARGFAVGRATPGS